MSSIISFIVSVASRVARLWFVSGIDEFFLTLRLTLIIYYSTHSFTNGSTMIRLRHSRIIRLSVFGSTILVSALFFDILCIERESLMTPSRRELWCVAKFTKHRQYVITRMSKNNEPLCSEEFLVLPDECAVNSRTPLRLSELVPHVTPSDDRRKRRWQWRSLSFFRWF